MFFVQAAGHKGRRDDQCEKNRTLLNMVSVMIFQSLNLVRSSAVNGKQSIDGQ